MEVLNTHTHTETVAQKNTMNEMNYAIESINIRRDQAEERTCVEDKSFEITHSEEDIE